MSLNEVEFCKDFYKTFRKFSKNRIALYGTGAVTEFVIRNLKDSFNFVGIIDFNSSKKELCGIKLLSKSEIKNIDCIIIMNRSPLLTQNIYDRISKDLKGINIFNLQGKKLRSKAKKVKKTQFFSSEKIQKIIDSADVVSFDFFDTLVTRTIKSPDDVWKIVGNFVSNELQIDDFYYKRNLAAKQAVKNASISDIYRILKSDEKIKSYADLIMAYEMKVEKSLIIPRNDVIKLFKYAQSRGKIVYILSDMYLPRSFFENICAHNDIPVNYENIWISCESKAGKKDGTLFKLLKRKYPKKKIVHIGDNELSDVKMAKKMGIKGIPVLNSMDAGDTVFENFSSKTIFESISYGLSVSKMYNSPWQKSIQNCFDYGYCILGPILFNWLLWIINEVKDYDNDNDYVYFVSRDGWFTHKLFNFLAECMSIKKTGIYLVASRIFLSYIMQELKENKLSDDFDFTGTEWQLYRYRFGFSESSKACINADKNTIHLWGGVL